MIKEKTKKSTFPGYSPEDNPHDCFYVAEKADEVVSFFKERLTFIEGEKAGHPFIPEPWQENILRALFGWYRPDGTRRYREAFLFVPRKNGKTPFCAGIINYVAYCEGEPGAQIYSSAGDREQASLIYRHASEMIYANAALSKHARTYKSLKSIEFFGGGVIYKALSAEANTKHGLNAQLIVNDELHIQPDRDLVDTLETATASRRQPIIVHITTAGFDKHSICYEKYDYACKIRDGVIDNPYFLPVIYEASPGDDWRDEKTWQKANPNYGVSVNVDYLRKECKEAVDVPAKENTFKRLHLNIWTEQETRWLSKEAWSECFEDYSEADLEGQPCYGGLDLSSTTDLTVFTLYFPMVHKVLCYCFAPKENAMRREKKDKVPYLLWAKDGYIELTDGNAVDYDFIRSKINKLKERFDIRSIGIDPWNAVGLINNLVSDRFEILKVPQRITHLTFPAKELEKLIALRTIRHNNNPVLNWCISNVSVTQDAAGNIMPSKAKSTERIDCVSALLNSIAVCAMKPVQQSVYEERGAIVL